MKARHLTAALTAVIIICSACIYLVITGLKNDPSPKKVGEFVVSSQKTTVFQSGECQIFATEYSKDNIGYFYSCTNFKK